MKLTALGTIPFGLIFLGVGLAVAFVTPRLLAKEMDPLEQWPRPASAAALLPGSQVVLSGAIADESPVLIGPNLVLAQRETRNRKGEWTAQETAEQPLDLVFADGSRVRVLGATGNCRGNTYTHSPQEAERWVGLVAGSPWTVVGLVEATQPPTVTASHHFGGTPEQYRDMLRMAAPTIYAFSLVFSLIGIGLVGHGARRFFLG